MTPTHPKVRGEVKKVPDRPVPPAPSGQPSRSLLRELSLLIGERTLEIITGLAAMVLVERSSGQSGLGVYSYLISLYTLIAYFAEWGIPHRVERETSLHGDVPSEDPLALARTHRTLLTLGLFAALLLFASAAFDAAHTRIEERIGAYLLIGSALPLRNINRLRLALLNGAGRHEEAAGLQGKKRLVFLGTVALLAMLDAQPSYLVAGCLAGELYLVLAGRKIVKLPPARSVPADPALFRSTLRDGSRLLFADDALEAILYVDLLVLGFFMPSRDLGIYAEASMLARFFLLIPLSIRPVLRRKILVPAGHANFTLAAALARKASARLFALHSFLLVYLLLFFPYILHFFFRTQGEEPVSFQVFKVFVPGLLVSASAVALEPLHEALGRADSLKRMILGVLAVNFILNAYLVPVGGLTGAAFATMLSMLLYFVLVGLSLERPYRLSAGAYLAAGGAVYITGSLLNVLHTGALLSACLLPALLGLLFYATGFFDGATFAIPKTDGGESGRTTQAVDI